MNTGISRGSLDAIEQDIITKNAESEQSSALDMTLPGQSVNQDIGMSPIEPNLSLGEQVAYTAPGNAIEFPAIENDKDFKDALSVYRKIPDFDEDKLLFGNAIADFQTQRIFKDYEDPAEGAAGEERRKKEVALDALTRDWKEFPEARKKAVDVFGEGFALNWEEATPSARSNMGTNKVLEQLYSQDGDGEFDSWVRYKETHGLMGNVDVWKHYTEERGKAHQVEDAEEKVRKGFEVKVAPMIESLLQGKTFMESMDSIPNLTPEEKDLVFLKYGQGSEWYKSVARAREWSAKYNSFESIPDDQVAARAEELKNEGNKKIFVGAGQYVDMSAEARGDEYFQNQARRELESEREKLTEKNTLNLANDLLKLKKEDQRAYEQVVSVCMLEIDRKRNDGTAFVSPMARTIGLMLDKGVTHFERMMVGDLEDGDKVELRSYSPNSFPIPYTFDKEGKSVVRPPKQEVSKQLSELYSMLNEITESPDGASWIRRQFDGLGGMAGQTALYLGTYGIGTFASVAGDRFNELHGNGSSLGSAFWRSAAAGATEVAVERVGGEFFGRNLRWLAKKMPGVQKFSGYIGGATDMLKAGMYKQAGLRYGVHSVLSGASEWAEELIQPTLQAPLDSSIAYLFDEKNGMSVQDWKDQLGQAYSPDLIFQMMVFGAACGVIQTPAMAREAKIARMGKGAIQALTRCDDARAQKIADIIDPVEKRNALIEEGMSNALSADLQKENMMMGIQNMKEDFSSLQDMEAYRAEVELGNMPRAEEQEDGTWELYNKETDESGKAKEVKRIVSADVAMAEINARLEDGVAQRIATVQSNLVSRALINSMKTSGGFKFDTMPDTLTEEHINQLAKAAGLRILDGASPQGIDVSLSRTETLGQLAAMPKAVEKRKQIARNQGAPVDRLSTNAYRITLNKSQSLIKYVEGKINFNELLEETLESNVSSFLESQGLSDEWAVGNLREVQKQLGVKLISEKGEATRQDVVEAMGILARGDFMSRVDTLNLPEFLKDFLKWVRSMILQNQRLAELGRAFRELDAAGKLDKTFSQAIYDAAGLTQEFWAEAAMDSSHAQLARIASVAISGEVDESDIRQGAYQAWKESAGIKEDEIIPLTQEDSDRVDAMMKEIKEDNSSSVSFSIFSPSEASGLHALQSITKGAKEARFRSDTLNDDVCLPLGNAGKLKDSGSVTGAYGFLHILTTRMAHGESLDEACYTCAKAVMAAVNGRINDHSSSKTKKELRLDDYSTWVYLRWKDEEKAWMVTGYKESDKKTSADDRRKAMNLAEDYALDSFGGLNEVGAALDYAIARVAREYKANIGKNAISKPALPQTNSERFALAMRDKLSMQADSLKSGLQDDGAIKQIADIEMQKAAWSDFDKFPELKKQAEAWDGESSLDDIIPSVADTGVDASQHNREDNFHDTASFSVVGVKAKNWEILAPNAFAGRDDGKLRVEIDASQSSIKPDVVDRIDRRIRKDKSEKKVRFTLESVLDFPALYEAYPKLAKMPVLLAELGSRGTRAWYNHGARNIKINTLNFNTNNYDVVALKSTLLHEVQHAIQSIEGYASGSGGGNYEAYLRAGGEIESRNVQNRMDMTAAERAANPFNETLEYPGEAIVRTRTEPIEVPFSLVSGRFDDSWHGLERSTNKHHIAFVKLLVEALNKDAERLARYNELSEDERGDMAITLMRATNIAKTAVMYMPKGFRIGLKPYLDWMEVFSEVAHTGKLDWAASAPAQYWSQMMKTHLEKMNNAFSIVTNDTSQALELMKDYGETRLYMLLNKLIKRVSGNLEEYGKCKVREKIDALLESCKPKQKDNHQYKTGALSMEAFRDLARLNGMMNMEEEAFEKELERIDGELFQLRSNEEVSSQDKIEELEAQKMELEVYGCMGVKGLDELERLHVCLSRFIAGEKESWKQELEGRKERRREIGEAIVAGVAERKGDLDSTTVARARNDDNNKGKKKGLLRRTFIGLQTIESFPQLLTVMERFEDTGLMAHNVRIRLGRASAMLAIQNQRIELQFRKWGMEAFGIKEDGKGADFKLDATLTSFKKKRDTGIKLNVYERKNLRVPIDIAQLRTRGEIGEAGLEEMKSELLDRKRELTEQLANEMGQMSGSLDTDKELKEVDAKLAAIDMELDEQDMDALREWIDSHEQEIAVKTQMWENGKGRKPVAKTFADVSYNRFIRQEATNLELAKDSALYIILLSEQEDYKQLMELHGFNDHVIGQLQEFVGKEGLILGSRMRGYLKRQGKRIGKVFEALNGVPFPQIDNYYPARFKIDNKLADFDMAQMLAGMQGQYGTTNGFLAGRTKHNRDLDLNMCATSVFRDAVATSEHWMQTQDIVADLRGILGTKQVIDALTVQFGKNSVALLKQWLHGLENCGRIDGNAKSMMDVTTRETYGASSISVLAYKLESVIRQVSGVMNMWAGDTTLTMTDWLRGMSMTLEGEGIGLLEMKNSSYVKSRIFGAKQIAGANIARMEPGRKFLAGDRIAHLGMVPMGYIDAMSNGVPAAVLFNAHYARAAERTKPDGTKRTDAECREIAWDYTYAAFSSGAQPMFAWEKSHFGNMVSSHAMGRAFTYMMSENFQKLGLVSSLLRGGRKGKAAGVWFAYGFMNAVIGAVLDYMRDDPDEWDERKLSGYLWAVAFGNLSGIPIVSELLEQGLNQLGWKDVYLGSAGRGIIDGKSLIRGGKKTIKMMTDDEEYTYEDWIKSTSTLMRTFGCIGRIGGDTAGSIALAAAALGNPVKSAVIVKDSAVLDK